MGANQWIHRAMNTSASRPPLWTFHLDKTLDIVSAGEIAMAITSHVRTSVINRIDAVIDTLRNTVVFTLFTRTRL